VRPALVIEFSIEESASSAVVRYIPSKSSSLPRRGEFTPLLQIPAHQPSSHFFPTPAWFFEHLTLLFPCVKFKIFRVPSGSSSGIRLRWHLVTPNETVVIASCSSFLLSCTAVRPIVPAMSQRW
jgi:hypothetical protein